MITGADEKVLERLVGSVTFARGRGYARGGAVHERTWNPSGTRAVGEVQGGAREPYVVSVTLTRGRSEQLTGFHSTCTCPVAVSCKHAVALVLAPVPAVSLTLVDIVHAPARAPRAKRAGGSRREGPLDAPASWEVPLRALLETDERSPQVGVVGIGLQFERVPDTGGPGLRGPGIRLRPVIPGRNGGWVRTGISWRDLDYARYRSVWSPRADAQLRLVKEVLALSRLGARRSTYSYTEDVVRLEAIQSRRLWDLLLEGRDLGLAMVQPGRHAGPIRLRDVPGEVEVDVTRIESGLRVEARITIEHERLRAERILLIGAPAYAVAWWDDSFGAAAPLTLDALATPVDEKLRALLERSEIDVPASAEKRLVEGLIPHLRRRVAVTSSDESVELPEDRPTMLVATIRVGEGHRLSLTWERLAREAREPLWDDSIRDLHRPGDDAVIEAVTALSRRVPALLERTPFGERLAGEAQLEGMAAVQFVTELLPLLEEMDDVEVEQIGTLPDYREAVSAPVVHLSGAATSGEDWFDLTVTVSVGDDEVPFAQLFVALAEGATHLILSSGTYFSLDRDDLRELATLIAEARGLHEAPEARVRLSRFQASLWEDFQRLGVITAQASEWDAAVRQLVGASDRTEYDAPDTLRATLRPYQLSGFNWLVFLYERGLGGILADDMGLGKTLQALALMCHTREHALSDEPFLVVAPTSVVGNWAAECQRFAPDLGVVTITETERRRGVALADLARGADVVITSYSLFRLEYDQYAGVEWAGAFLDEAQFAKNRASQTYQRIKALPVSFKVAMSGTPLENNLMELWSLFSITAPGLFASPERFAEYYRVPIERRGDAQRLSQLRRRVRPLLLRRTKEQVATDLPDKQEQVLELDLNARHHKVYQTYLQRERQKVLGLLDDMTKNRFEIFRSLTLLRQASLDVSLVDAKHAGVSSTKLDALMEMLEDIVGDGHRVLVFSQFTRFLALARARIRAAGIEHCYLDGRTRNRPAVIAGFREGVAPVFLISLKAGGFGLNLTEADYCILLDPWWNPATEAQAVDRVHRIGQTRKVMVYRLVAKDTLEEKVMALKAKKAALFTNVLDGGGFESGAMTAKDIRDLLE